MHKQTFRIAAIMSALLLIVIVIGNVVIVAQSSITGTWTADTRDKDTRDGDSSRTEIQLSLKRSSDRGNMQNSKGMMFAELEGLTRDQTQNSKVHFRLVREAGVIECDGSFSNGVGSGTFVFHPDTAFFDGMRSRGFDFAKTDDGSRSSVEDRMLAAAIIDVRMATADDLLSANFGPLDVDDLFKAAIFKIDGQFMSEMKATGFPNLTMGDLVKARIFKIDAAFVSDIRGMGYASPQFEDLVKFRIFKITPEFLSQLRAAGLTDVSAEDLVKCRIFNIDADFVRQAKASEPNISVSGLVEMKIGVRRHRDN